MTESLNDRERDKYIKKLERRVARAEEQLANYEKLVDRTQHLLNTRIEEVEKARAELTARTWELERSETRFRQLADAAFETILIHAEGEIVDCNDAAVNLYGCSKDRLIGKPVIELVESPVTNEDKAWITHATEEPIEGVHIKVGGKVPVEVRSRAIELKGEAALVTVVRDITEHKKIQEYLHKIANTDALTGIGNRRYFLEQGKNEFARAVRYHQTLSLIMMDIDKFKSINDTYGHDIGDLALQSLTDICVKTLRENDVFARLGGEEFAAVLPSTGIDGALQLSERLRENIHNMVTPSAKGDIQFTASMGVTEVKFDDDNEDIESMLNRADKGLYQAKITGRNRVISV